MVINKDLLLELEKAQLYEITEHKIYMMLSNRTKNIENKDLLMEIGLDELRHYNILKKYTEKEFKPIKILIIKYFVIAKFLGLTFALKLMEKGENKAQINYNKYILEIPELKAVVGEEDEHESALINRIDEKRVKYVSSMVLGLNDALVELSGSLVGFTFALKDSNHIALAGLIVGIAASLSMASSELLSKKSEDDGEAIIASLFTGGAYVGAVIAMIAPYLLLDNYIHAFIAMNIAVVLIILFFNIFVSVVKDKNFKRSFFEMLLVVLVVSGLSFAAAIFLRNVFGIDVG